MKKNKKQLNDVAYLALTFEITLDFRSTEKLNLLQSK